MLTNGLLNEGTPGRDAGAIADGFERLGADFSNGAYRDQAVAGLRTLADPAHSEPALALLADATGRPADAARHRADADEVRARLAADLAAVGVTPRSPSPSGDTPA